MRDNQAESHYPLEVTIKETDYVGHSHHYSVADRAGRRKENIMNAAAENSVPEAEITALRKEIEFLKSCGVIELAIRNPNVSSWMRDTEKELHFARSQAAASKVLATEIRKDTLNEILASIKKHSSMARTQMAKSGSVEERDVWSGIVSHLDLFFDSIAMMKRSGPAVSLHETASAWQEPKHEVVSAEPIPAVAAASPVATITRQKVVSGKYGRVRISKGSLTPPREVWISLTTMSLDDMDMTVLTAREVREMRDVLTAILPVLEAE